MNMKVKSKIYKGIEYIQFSDLPQDQQELLSKTLNQSIYINILVGEKILSDCIQFRDYVLWFDSIFLPKPTAVNSIQPGDKVPDVLLESVAER
jgi:hypothetical protein